MHDENYQKALDRIQVAKETNATKLNFNGWALTEMPPTIKELKQLKSLNLTYNFIEDYSFLQDLPNLTKLNLEANQLYDITFLKNLTLLKDLDLSDNLIEEFSVLNHLRKLKKLYIHSNDIDDTSFFTNLIQLEVLDLSNVVIRNYDFLKKLPNLTSLILNSCKIDDYSFLNDIKCLKKLQLFGNEIKDITFLKDLTKLTDLTLMVNQISDITPLEKLIHLEYLFLERNQISDISVIKNFPKLRRLGLWENKISDISIFTDYSFVDLLFLSLMRNEIKDFSAIKHLPSLTTIYLSDHQISDISFLKDLPNLKELLLDHNQISDIFVLKYLKCLGKLNLSANPITDISVLKDLNELTELRLNSTQIQDFDLDLNCFPKLKSLCLKDTPIQNIPKAIVDLDNCCEALRNYQKDAKNADLQPNDRQKIVFVGNGQVGKTSLMRVLQGKPFREDEPSTHGIFLETWKPNKQKPLQVAIWDFGGQHLYHSTHRMFLRTDAIIVLCWDFVTENSIVNLENPPKADFQNHPLEYWLDFIKTLGRKSPIFLVQTKINAPNQKIFTPIRLNDYRDKYSIQACFHVDSRTDKNMSAFKTALVEFIQEKVEKEAPIPKNWYKVREAIGNLQKKPKNKQLATDAFIKLCKLHQVDEDSAITLRDYLHNIGVFFYQKKTFGNQIILDQKWAIDAVYTLFDRESRFYELIEAKNGLFQAKDLAKSWQNYTQAEREVFIGFMLQCEICFELNANRTPFDEKEWVAPSLLPKKSPVSVNSHFRDDDNTVRFLQYRFDFLHSGVIQSFIVRTHKLSNQHSMWRNGIWLDDGNSMALLRADEVQKTITIQVKGSNSKTLLDKIRNLFNEIHDLKPAEWVSNHGKSYLPLVEIENNIHLMNFTYSGERYNVTDYQYFLNVNPNARFSMDMLLFLEQRKSEEMVKLKRLTEMRANAGVESVGSYENAILSVKDELQRLEVDIKKEKVAKNQPDELQSISLKDSEIKRSKLPIQQGEPQDASTSHQVPAPNSLTTVLMLTAIPAGRPKLNLDKEHSAILFKLQKQPSKFNFQLRKTVTINDFKEFPEEIKPDILHFSGHGVSGVQSGIVVQNDDHNGETIIPTKGLEQLFVYYKAEQLSFQVVLLNACYSAKQAAVIAKHVPFVIGTTIPINDDRATAFSTGFYFKLEKEFDIERAFQSGVTAACLKGASAKDFVLYKGGKKVTSK